MRRITMARKIISIVAAVLFLINDICFGLGVMPGSTQPTKGYMYAAAQKLLAIRRGTGAINFDESNLPRRFEGGRGLIDPKTGAEYIGYASKYQTNSVPVDYENPPTGWKNNPILKETSLIKAFEIFRDTQARISADRLEIKEGWFPVNEDAGELPIARIERMGEDKYVLILHTKFVKMWNHIRENDVWFELYMGKYDRRTVSAAWGVFYRLAKHEMAELSKLGDIVKSAGHISYNPESLPQDDETLANEIGGNYALVNDAIWLWFLGAYCFNDKTRYDNDEFLKRIDWFFDSPEARALKLHLEFPNLEKDKSKRILARAFAFTINHDFFNRPNIHGPKDINSPVNPEFIKQYEERLALREKSGITEAYIFATGNAPDNRGEDIDTPLSFPHGVSFSPDNKRIVIANSGNNTVSTIDIKKANTPVELLPAEMQTRWFTFRFNRQLRRLTKGQPDAVEKQFEIARELAKLIQILDSFEGRYYYIDYWTTSRYPTMPFRYFGPRSFPKVNKKRTLQVLKKSSSPSDALRMINVAQRIAQDIEAQIDYAKLYRLSKIGDSHQEINDILVKVDLLPLIDEAISIQAKGFQVKTIVKGLVFADIDRQWRKESDSPNYIWIPQIDIHPTEPAQDKPAQKEPAAIQLVKQTVEKPGEQLAKSAGKLSFDEQVGMIKSFLEKNEISENSLILTKKPFPTPSLKISNATKLTDISSLAGAAILKTLILANTSVEDIGPVANLVNLEILSLSFNPIKDISAVANLTNLKELYLDWTQVTDISPLKGLALDVLDLSRTKVSDLTPLKGMNLARLYLDGAKSITDEQKQIYELFKNHPNPKNLKVINSFGKLIMHDNIQDKGPIIIGGYPTYMGDSGIKEPAAIQPVKQASEEPQQQPAAESVKEESTLINDISEYIVQIGLDKGPGAVELPPNVTADIYKMINLLHDSQIEIFVPQSFKLTANMKKALKDIGKREGREPIQCREYSDDRRLLELLRKAPVPGVKRMVLEEPQDKKSAFLSYLVHENPEVFRFIRLLSVSLPQGYQKMESGVKTVHQAKMMTMAILARLFEKDKTPMVEALLRGMLRESLDVDDEAFTRFMNELGMSDENIEKLTTSQITLRVIHLLDKPIRLVEKIGREIHLMKVFWEAA